MTNDITKNWRALLESNAGKTLSDRTAMTSEWTADDTWNAGDLGCGELVVELRRRVKVLRPRQILHLIAHDPGALEDIPAWCRLTGHALKKADHPNYLIERKEF